MEGVGVEYHSHGTWMGGEVIEEVDGVDGHPHQLVWGEVVTPMELE